MPNRPSILKLTTRRALLAGAGTVLGVVLFRNSLVPHGLDGPPLLHPLDETAGGGGQDVEGGMGNFRPTPERAALPDLVFTTETGGQRALAEYRGQAVVLNFWATWCGPCVQEMPSLQALARSLAGSGIVVLAVSADRAGAASVRPFLDAHGITSLPVLLDPDSNGVHALGLSAFPTTLLVDRDGRERGRLEGSANWGSAAAMALVRRVLGAAHQPGAPTPGKSGDTSTTPA